MRTAYLLLLAFAALHAQTKLPDTSTKFRAVRLVYDRLVRASGSPKTPPTLVVTAGKPRDPGLLARFNSDYIQVSEHLYDTCVALKARVFDCISGMVGHELAHFYQGHLWKLDMVGLPALPASQISTLAGPNPQEIAKAAERRAQEAQADFAGGLLAFQAGYQPLTYYIALLKEFSNQYGIAAGEALIAKDVRPYPTIEERLAIAQLTAIRLRDDFYPVFDAGLKNFLIGHYSLAAYCFDYIGKYFVSREILSNAAVAYIMQALDESPALPEGYVYPLQVDFDTRLFPQASSRSSTTSLAAAVARLESAMQLDPDYPPAPLTLGIAKSLQRKNAEAAALAGKAYDLAKAAGRNDWLAQAATLRGIIAGRSGDKAKAAAAFEEAAALGSPAAAANRKVLDGAIPPDDKVAPPNARAEQIARWTPADPASLGISSHKVVLRAPSDFDLGLELRLYKGAGVEAMSIVDSADKRRVTIVSTQPAYTGATAKGLKIGSSAADLARLYGAPIRTRPARSGSYRLYADPSLLVYVDEENKVAGWCIYNVLSMER